MSDVKRIYVEKRAAYATEANEIKHNLIEQLGLEIDTLRIINRYDIQGVNDDILKQGINTILAEPMIFIKKNFLLMIKKQFLQLNFFLVNMIKEQIHVNNVLLF